MSLKINPSQPGDYQFSDTFTVVRDASEQDGNMMYYQFQFCSHGMKKGETLILPVDVHDVDRLGAYLAQQMQTSDAHKVLEFTEGSSGQAVPRKPQPMTRAQVEFLVKMMASELVELAQTVTADHEEARKMVAEAASTDAKPDYVKPTDPTALAAHQADAIVDSWYYGLNAAAKCGINLSALFQVVHAANMAKRDPHTGQFVRDARGKVIKPKDWQEPDIIGEIARQAREGAW